MDNTSDLLKNKYTFIDDSIIFLVGLIVTIIVISAEAYVLKKYHNILEHGVKKIMKLPKLLKK